MTAQGEGILAFLDCVLTEQERALTPLVGLGTCPDWGHCQPECTHQFGINDSEAKLRRCAAERKILELHGGRGHSCPAYDYDGDLDEHARFYDHEACPVVRHLAEGYGWTGDEQRLCGYTKRHPSHTFMRLEVLFQCPGEHGTEGKR